MPSYSVGQAAQLLGVSSETVRRWADGGRLGMERDGAGKRAIEGAALARFAKERGAGLHAVPEDDVPTSVRNSFVGIVTAVRVDDVAARIRRVVDAGPPLPVCTRRRTSRVRVADESRTYAGTYA